MGDFEFISDSFFFLLREVLGIFRARVSDSFLDTLETLKVFEF